MACCRLDYLVIFILFEFIVVAQGGIDETNTCKDESSCSMTLIETIPAVLKYREGAPKHEKISTHWRRLINTAKKNIDILSFYWTMKGSDVEGGPYSEAAIGEQVLADLKAAAQRGVSIRIVQNKENIDTRELSQNKNITVRTLDMKRLMKAGIVHTKFFAVDGQNAYVGSANFDWRALTEVKELGMAIYGCKCTVEDVLKIFETNWMLAVDDSKIPSQWPEKYWTQFNKDRPITVKPRDRPVMNLYWSTSPPAFCAPNRTSDISAILDMITKAEKYVYIAVMDYYAAFIYIRPKKYWDMIDRALREAVFNRGVVVHLMTSKWGSTRQQEIVFLKSLNEFGKMPDIKDGSLKVKLFEMPSSKIPYARVSHSKFMVTDKAIFISTSNWSGDYFENTGGVSLVIDDINSAHAKHSSMHEELKQTFLRDWESSYTKEVDAVDI